MLFEMKDKALPEIESFDKKIGIFDKVKDVALDINSKEKHLGENFSETENSYDIKIQDIKHKISWAKDFFIF